MAKVNKALAAKKARGANLYNNGVMRGQEYMSHYDQGFQAYANRTAYSKVWHPHKQQGWIKARNRDLEFLDELRKCSERQAASRTPKERRKSEANIAKAEMRIAEMLSKSA